MNIKRAIIAVAIAAAATLTGARASATGTHHPDCVGLVKDIAPGEPTPVAGDVYVKAGNQHHHVGYHDAGYVATSPTKHDVSHVDVCPPPQTSTTTTTTTTTEVPPSTTTTTTAPTSSTSPADTTSSTSTTSVASPSTVPSSSSTDPAPTTTAPVSTSTSPPSATVPDECDAVDDFVPGEPLPCQEPTPTTVPTPTSTWPADPMPTTQPEAPAVTTTQPSATTTTPPPCVPHDTVLPCRPGVDFCLMADGTTLESGEYEILDEWDDSTRGTFNHAQPCGPVSAVGPAPTTLEPPAAELPATGGTSRLALIAFGTLGLGGLLVGLARRGRVWL